MQDVGIEEIASAWIAFSEHAEHPKEEDDNFWAYEHLSRYVSSDSSRAMDIILCILSINHSERVLANVGAGPLEELLLHHGDEILERVEFLANNNAYFHEALGMVWVDSLPGKVRMALGKLL